MWGEKAHYPGPHLWKCLVYMWSFPFTCSNLSLQVKVFNKTCEIVIFNMSEMSFACQMSSWRGKQITCANISFAHVICFPHMWNTANHMNACNPPDSALPRVFCTWFVGDKSQSLIKKNLPVPMGNCDFFFSRVFKEKFCMWAGSQWRRTQTSVCCWRVWMESLEVSASERTGRSCRGARGSTEGWMWVSVLPRVSTQHIWGSLNEL